MVVGAQKLLICWDFPSLPSLGFTDTKFKMGKNGQTEGKSNSNNQNMQKSTSDVAEGLQQQKTIPDATPVS